MIKISKNLIATYSSLDNKKADEYLSKVADDIYKEIKTSDNDQIYDLLDLLEEFVYKVPKQTVEIVRHIILNPQEPKLIDNPLGAFKGNDYGKVAIKALELLGRIRYIHPDGVLPQIAEYIRCENKEIRDKASEILRKSARYDFNVLTKSQIGYGAQRKTIDYILAWSNEEKMTNLEFIEIAAEQLLSSSIEGTTSETMDSITMHFGAVQPTEFLKNLRRETIDLIFNLYQNILDEKKKIKLVKVLEEASRTPINVKYGDDLTNMIAEDAEYLLVIYRKMLFDNANKLVGSIAVAEEIEKRLYWFHKNSNLDSEASRKLRNDILSDPFYSVFRLLVGDDMTFREEDGFEKAEQERNEAIDVNIEEINNSNLEYWISILNRIAAQNKLIDAWQFNYFNHFLRKLTVKKPELAENILINAMKEEAPVMQFASYFLGGYREINQLDIWDKLVKELIIKQDPSLVSAIAYSLVFDRDDGDSAKKIREVDLYLLENMAEQKNEFDFLNRVKDKNHLTQLTILNTLIRNYKRDTKLMGKLIITILRNNQGWKNYQIQQLSFGIHRKSIDYSEFNAESIEFLINWIVEIGDLDWHAQDLLLDLGKKDLKIILDIFWKRMEKEATDKSKKKTLYEPGHYRAIPYHFNDNLVKYISGHPDFQKSMEAWVDKMTLKWSLYNWNISQFLNEMGESFNVIFNALIEKGDDGSLSKAVQLLDRFESGNIELCMEIAKRTDNKKILAQVDSIIYATGVVTGEDGFARAFESKIERLKKYLTEPNEKAREFAKKMISSLEQNIVRERKNNEEERQLRKIEFEG